MTSLTQEAFVLKAIERLPSKGSHHLSIRRGELLPVFRRHFGAEAPLDSVLDCLIREKKIVAARLVWAERPKDCSYYNWKSTIQEVARLDSFPDPIIEETDPILYLPDRVPRKLKGRLGSIEDALRKILSE